MKVMGKHIVEVRNVQNVKDKACVQMRTVEMWKDELDQRAMLYIKLDSGWLPINLG